MKIYKLIITLVICTYTITISAQVKTPSKILKSINEYQIKNYNPLIKNDTVLTKESLYDSTGQLLLEKVYKNNIVIVISYKKQNGTITNDAVNETLTVPCKDEKLSQRLEGSLVVEEEYWGDCPEGKIYYKKFYNYEPKTYRLLNINKFNSEGKITEITLFKYEYYK